MGVQAAQQMHECRLTAAAGADDGDKLALLDAEVDSIKRPDLLIADPIRLYDILQEDQRHDRP